MVVTSDTWLEKSAITWNDDLVQGHSISGRGSYWEAESLLRIPSMSAFESGAEENRNKLSNLSYHTVITTTAYLVDFLRAKLQAHVLKRDRFTPDNGNQLIGVSVAVAIPEGPLQALAILAVHALNVPFSVGDESKRFYCVLVPIEPGEGKDRIRHMLQDTKAAMILCLDADRQHLQNILRTVQSARKDTSRMMSGQGLYRSNSSILVDFLELVRDATSVIRLQTHPQSSSTSTSSSTLSLMRDYLLGDDGDRTIQELVAACSQIVTCCNSTATSIAEGHPTLSQEVVSPASSENRISHVVYTSGTTGVPKGCVCSIRALQHYLGVKNKTHGIDQKAIVLLASSLSFDPCLSDILATFQARAKLGIASRVNLRENLPHLLQSLDVTHVLCTPTLWGTMSSSTLDGTHSPQPKDFPSLRVVALGGEPIPKQILQAWGRRSACDGAGEADRQAKCCLFATYGVTEACVYQTFGEVGHGEDHEGSPLVGNDVGGPLDGTRIRICLEGNQDELVDAIATGDQKLKTSNGSSCVGEVVLYGTQVDALSCYLNQRELSEKKFVSGLLKGSRSRADCFFYRTGDRGWLDIESGRLLILGRIHGDSMVKINGVRVEMGEIEAALVDESNWARNSGQFHASCSPVVVDAAARVTGHMDEECSDNSPDREMKQEIHAYCVLSRECARELGMEGEFSTSCPGILCADPLLVLLQTRCREKVRAGVTPSAFILVPKMPSSPTGKRSVASLPPLDRCGVVSAERNGENVDLRAYGRCGKIVAEQITSCMNLQPCQQSMLTTNTMFSMLGGDSLAATRVVRALYALHHNVQNSRFLGGMYGTIDGPFAATHLIVAENLGQYVDHLDKYGVFAHETKESGSEANDSPIDVHHATVVENHEARGSESNDHHSKRLYNALMKSASCGHTAVAIALLDVGADPNSQGHSGRLGKVSGRNNRKAIFRSSPLHIACLRGNAVLVERLLQIGSKYTSPDASGGFPMHLAASGDNSTKQGGNDNGISEDCTRRLHCVKYLLEAGAPIFMKDGNKQTVLHCAARAGNCNLIIFVVQKWKEACGIDAAASDESLDWRDHWFRTPVHWAVLSGHVAALRTLLEMGCAPNPPKVKVHKRSSAASETPVEMCERLYGTTEGIGLEIFQVLKAKRNFEVAAPSACSVHSPPPQTTV